MLKVFLVEDEALIREGLREKIPWEQYGYKLVGDASDGEMALPMIRKTRPDVLITDIKMPFMDGLELSKIVREDFSAMKIIIISGYDDFEYAREAIRVGVDQYLLKPITRMNLRKVLQELKEKIEQDMEHQDYQVMLQNEMHKYEQFSQRRFFEQVLAGKLSVSEIYDEASKWSIDLSAQCYNLMFLYLKEQKGAVENEGMEQFVRKQEEILNYFLRNPQYHLFRWNVNCYGVLIKADTQQMEKYTKRGLEHIQTVCDSMKQQLDWHVAVGNPVERLSALTQCYQQVSHYGAYRFLLPSVHILSEETLAEQLSTRDEKDIAVIDTGNMSPDVILDFLDGGTLEEVHDFVESYLEGVRKPMESRMFRDYVILNIRFTILTYVETIEAKKEEFLEFAGKYGSHVHISKEEVFEYFVETLRAAITLRDAESHNQNSRTLKNAKKYIDENYALESLSLSTVACAVDVSANYLSSIFSQSEQKTFTEYVTEKRMEKARKLLGYTNRSLGDIASDVGFKDSHYFSYVFKKTQGISPREYRSTKKG